MRTCPVILEYCGGAQTDWLDQLLSSWNPRYEICVLDNASPRNRCRRITHQNTINTFIGGGIIDCVALAERRGAAYVLLIMNDIVPQSRLDIAWFEETMESRPEVVQVGCSLTPDSNKARVFPWTVTQFGGAVREVPHSDLLCSMLRVEFIKSFGGFPFSKSGWGYDVEIAYQAYLQHKTILIADQYIIAHTARPRPEAGTNAEKLRELQTVHEPRYGDLKALFHGMLREQWGIQPFEARARAFDAAPQP